MTDPPGNDRDAAGVDGDFLTVEQLAQLRHVTPAAVRAQLRAGTLAGEQVLQGQRAVWRIPMRAARRYLERSGAPSPTAAQEAAEPTGAPGDVRPSAPATAADPEPASPMTARGRSAAPTPVSSGRVEALEVEVRRLRRQLSALAEAHRRLLDAVTAGLTEDADRER